MSEDKKIQLIDEGESLAEQVSIYCNKLKIEGIDQRWLSIGITDLQKGFMSVIRSIIRPTTF
jgi:hypothetical protein